MASREEERAKTYTDIPDTRAKVNQIRSILVPVEQTLRNQDRQWHDRSKGFDDNTAPLDDDKIISYENNTRKRRRVDHADASIADETADDDFGFSRKVGPSDRRKAVFRIEDIRDDGAYFSSVPYQVLDKLKAQIDSWETAAKKDAEAQKIGKTSNSPLRWTKHLKKRNCAMLYTQQKKSKWPAEAENIKCDNCSRRGHVCVVVGEGEDWLEILPKDQTGLEFGPEDVGYWI